MMAGFGVEQKVVNQVPASPGSPRVADGCWKDGQQMTGCSKDLVDIPTTDRKGHRCGGGRVLTPPSGVWESDTTKVRLREKADGLGSEEAGAEDAVEESTGDRFGRERWSRSRHRVWERENTTNQVYICTEWLEVGLWSQAVWV